MEAAIDTSPKPARSPRKSTARPIAIEERLSILRREELRKYAQAALIDSPMSGKIQGYLSAEWGDVRKLEWQEIAMAVLEASAALSLKLLAAENRLDAICTILDDTPS